MVTEMNQLYERVLEAFEFRRLRRGEQQYRRSSPLTNHEEQAERFLDDYGDTEPGILSKRANQGGHSSHATSGSRLALSLPIFVALIMVFLSLGVTISVVFTQLKASKPANFADDGAREQTRFKIMRKPCGTTPAEARSRGCHFDVISFCWLPTRCYDEELSRSFDAIREWEWYLDPNRTQPLTHAEIMTGEYTDLYVNWEYHLRHCTAMWKKMHRAILSGSGTRAIDGYIGPYEHTEHCEHMLLGNRQVAFAAINTRIRVKYPDCGI